MIEPISQLQRIEAISQGQRAQAALAGQTARPAQTADQNGFAALLRQKLDQGGIEFSKHAKARVAERGLEVTDTLLTRLADSVARAQAKGAVNILALDQGQAFIINVPNGRVITAMDRSEMKDNVFTNIDGAVIL